MTIRDDVLRGSIPRLGTITTGRGVAATSKAGNKYSRPQKASGLVFHTDDGEVANVVLEEHGGTVHDDSPTWGFDVEVESREVDLLVIPSGFRQWLVHYRTEQCLRRCDGVRMVVADGKQVGVSQGGEVVDGEECRCAKEMERGRERTCRPSTVLPTLIPDLPIERFGVWEVRTNGWTSGRQLKGAVQALWMVGVQGGQVALPAQLVAVDDQVRSGEDVWQIVGLELRITASADRLVELSRASGMAEALGAGGPALPQGELPPDPSDARARASEERAYAALEEQAAEIRQRAEELELTGVLGAEWGEMFGDLRIEELGLGDLSRWVAVAGGVVEEAEDAARRHASGTDDTHPATRG